MEFLTLPSDPLEHDEPHILPLFSDVPYDGGPFLEYLDRHPRILLGTGFAVTLTDLCVHYQNWLFFGLLFELLGDQFDARDFICYDANISKHRITTVKLLDVLATWQSDKLDAVFEADYGFSHFRKCLEEVEKMLELTDRHFPGHGDELGFQIDVTGAVAEAITNVLKSHYSGFDRKGRGSAKPFQWLRVSYQAREDVLERTTQVMIERGGWCPNDCQRALDSFPTFEAWYYLRHLKLQSCGDRHGICSISECKVASSRHNSRLPRHTHRECRCRSITIQPRRLTRIYSRSQLPCLKLWKKLLHHGEGLDPEAAVRTNIALQPVTFIADDSLSYHAISHVWGDGTGNGHGNSLPRCQILALYSAVASWRDDQEPDLSEQPVLIWIDTICCPYQQGEGKNAALSMMKEIYANATAVHVMDRSLTTWYVRGHEDYLQTCVRLFFSPWMRRLWTAQEAIFTGVKSRGPLVIHCADACSSMTGLYRGTYQKRRYASTFAEAVASELVWLERSAWPGSGARYLPAVLSKAARLLEYRSTSVDSDEPLVLANILGLRGNDLIGLNQEDAMCKFWREIESFEDRGIPADIVFCPSKLMTPGFRWAPRTLMDPGKFSTHLFVRWGEERAKLTPQGLCAPYRGFRVVPQPLPHPRCLLGNEANRCGKNYTRISLELQDGSWFFIGHSEYSGEFTMDKMQLLYNRLRAGTLSFIVNDTGGDIVFEPVITHGMQLQFVNEVNGVLQATIDGHVGFWKMRGFSERLEVAARACAMDILRLLDSHTFNNVSERSVVDDGMSPQEDQERSGFAEEFTDQHVRRILASDPSLCETIRQNSREDINARRNWSFEQVVKDFTERVHHQAHVGPIECVELPDRTLWCLD